MTRASRPRALRRHQAGFTLTEMLVVVSIIGILVTLAVVYMRPRVRPIDVATRVGDLVREAARRAVALGPVRANVAVALGSKARTAIFAAQTGGSTAVTFTLYRLEEFADGSAQGNWIPLESYTTDKNVLAVNWAPGVGNQSLPGLSTTWNAPAPPAAPTAGFSLQCRPDGTCDSRSLFFQAAIAAPAYEQLARLSVMPLGGAINTATDWN